MPTIEARLREDGIVHVRVDGKLTPAEYRSFIPAFDAIVRGGARRKMLTELAPDFGGWTLRGLIADLRFDFRYRRYFGPTAILGYRRWQRVGTAALAPFYSVAVRFFPADKREEAEDWLAATSP